MKFQVRDLKVMHTLLKEKAKMLEEPFFEENTLYDTIEKDLLRQRKIIRLRKYNNKRILTLKGTPLILNNIKICEENEVELMFGSDYVKILEKLGYFKLSSYEKVRWLWKKDDVLICFDFLPFGCFIEFEGSIEGILSVIKDYNFLAENALSENYHSLNANFREKNNLPADRSFIFSKPCREMLRANPKAVFLEEKYYTMQEMFLG